MQIWLFWVPTDHCPQQGKGQPRACEETARTRTGTFVGTDQREAPQKGASATGDQNPANAPAEQKPKTQKRCMLANVTVCTNDVVSVCLL